MDWRPCEERQSTGNGGVRIFQVKSAFLTMPGIGQRRG
jgi:hypothetical protein